MPQITRAPEGDSVNLLHTRPQSRDSYVQIRDNVEKSGLQVVRQASVKTATETEQIPNAGTTDDAVAQTKAQRIRARIQLATLCWTLFLMGWNDGTTGPLLPRIQKVYHVNFAIVSLIFVFACVVGVASMLWMLIRMLMHQKGFLTGAFLNVVLNTRLGFGKVIVLGSSLQAVGYAIESAALPFPGLVFGYVITGIGLALQAPQANGFAASLRNSSTKLGIMHSFYGAGALTAPLVATQFAQLPHWSFHYLVSLGITLINTTLLIVVFRFKTMDECLAQIGQPARAKSESKNSHFRQMFASKVVHLLAVFVLVYIGVEVTTGGWIVTYIIDVRHGGPSSGYISSGFFGGMMAGRLVLLRLNKLVGERRILFVYAFLSIALELVIWFVPSLIGDAVTVSIFGVLLGPMYPIAINHAGRVLPAWLLTGSLGWISAFGQAGSAVFPFMTGAIASRAGIDSLQPLLVAVTAFMIFLWALVPSGGPQRTN